MPAADRTKPAPKAAGTRRAIGLAIAVVSIAALLPFAPARRAAYVQDDPYVLEENAVVVRGDVGEILTTDFWSGATDRDGTLYRPVAIGAFALEYRVAGGARPSVSHAINLALHLAVSLSVLALARRLGWSALGATAAAVVFATHPIHVEAVVGIVGRAELLAALFTLGALHAWLSTGARRLPARPAPPTARARAAAWLAALCVLLACGSKEIGFAALPLLAVFDLAIRPAPPPGRRRERAVDRAAAFAPTLLAVCVVLAMRAYALEAWWVVQRPNALDNPLAALGALERVPSALALLARYVATLVAPFTLSIDYSGPALAIERTLFAWRPLVGAGLLVGAIAAIVHGLRSSSPAHTRLALALALFSVPWAIVGQLLVPVGAVFAERFMYLPSVGFCLALGLVFEALARSHGSERAAARSRTAALVVAVLASGFALRTYAYASEWRSNETVFRAALRATDGASPRAHLAVGVAASDEGDVARALEHFTRAAELEPTYVHAHHRRGVALARSGRFDEALSALDEAVRRSPAFAEAHLNRGLVLERLGRADAARRALERAVLYDPSLATAWAALGHLAMRRAAPDDAVAAYRRAIALGRADLRAALEEAAKRASGPR